MSVKSETGVIKLGGETFDVKGLTFDQLQNIMPNFKMQAEAPLDLAPSRRMIAYAIGKTVEEIGSLKTTIPEIFEAVAIIRQVTGIEELGKHQAAAKKA